MEFGALIQEEFITWIIILAATLFLILAFNYFISRLLSEKKKTKFIKTFVQLTSIFFGLILVFLSLPIPEESKQSLLNLFGIIAGAAIALSSTTFIANAMSGMMLRLIKSFRVGDYIESNSVFGRVTDVQLLYTRIQSVERDLITIPNLKLISNPLKTIRTSGTIISTTVSLGYDVPRTKIEKKLVFAAEKVGLENPFVHIMELGDFSVTYRVGGLLKEIEGLITARSDFKKAVLDTLHGARIEIVSPNFMNQRILKEDQVFIPPKEPEEAGKREKIPEKKPEEIIFDKAIEAEILNRLEKVLAAFEKKEKTLEQQVNAVPDETLKESLREKLDFLKKRKEEVKAGFEEIKQQEEEEEKPSPEERATYLQRLNLKADHLYIRRKKLEKELEKSVEKTEPEQP